ncbi:MAG: histidine kinase [Cyclobacteriaceae bacterium]
MAFVPLSSVKVFLRIIKHLAIWTLLWLGINSISWELQGFNTEDGTYRIPSLYGTTINALIFYFNALYLYPTFWRRSKVKFFSFTVLMVLGLALLEAWFDLTYAKNAGILERFSESLGVYDKTSWQAELVSFFAYTELNVIIHILFGMLSFAYLLPKENIRNAQLQNEQLKSELRFLKSQIDPHTLFNGINGIYHLMDQDVKLAKEYLHGFANILRYQIYDCVEDFISLDKELSFLDKFFMLSNMRKQDDANISWELPQTQLNGLKIAPLILLPFVENAFKYLSDHEDSKSNWLFASLTLKDEKLTFRIENSCHEILPSDTKSSGMGLENVKNRLSLLYPNNHTLNVDHLPDCFKVNLTLDLK